MSATKNPGVIERLVAPLGDCLTEESARRLLALKPDRELQAQIDELATRHTEGRLSAEEQAEYRQYVSFATLVAILKSKARQQLATPPGR